MGYLFPFGQEVKRLEQVDRKPKEVFILGVYASAVYARWSNNGKVICQAFAVASEPYIFWNGDYEDAKRIINSIVIPEEVGKLDPACECYNGPSAKVLERNILKPLGIDRKQAWLCDLLPESRSNEGQIKIIEGKYKPLISEYNLNAVTVPKISKAQKELCDEKRRNEILDEIEVSQAKKLVLLGDDPIRCFLTKIARINFSSLNEYTYKFGYGVPYPMEIGNMQIEVIPIAHPRQIGRLGLSSGLWGEVHKKWEESLMA